MTKSKEPAPGELLPVVSPNQTQAVTIAAPSPAEMMRDMIKSGVTSENVAAFAELVKLSEHMEDRTAERDFNAAFVALQREMPRVQATKPVPNNDGTVRYRFAPYEEIMEQVQPYLFKHGFTVSFSTRYEEGRLIKTCILAHSNGHSRSNDFAVRIGSGPPKATETQADGAAGTYAKRFALCDALNIVVRGIDNDAANEGGKITKEQAAALRKRVAETASDEGAFLKYAKSPVADGASEADIVKAYESIPETMFGTLDVTLRRKERTK